MFIRRERKRFSWRPKRLFIIILSLICLFLLSFTLYRAFLIKSPTIIGLDDLKMLPKTKKIHLEVDSNFPVKSLNIEIIKDENSIILLKDNPNQSHKGYNLSILSCHDS